MVTTSKFLRMPRKGLTRLRNLNRAAAMGGCEDALFRESMQTIDKSMQTIRQSMHTFVQKVQCLVKKVHTLKNKVQYLVKLKHTI